MMALYFQHVLAGDFLRALLDNSVIDKDWDTFYINVLSDLGLEPGEDGWTEEYFQRKVNSFNNELSLFYKEPLDTPRRTHPSTYEETLRQAGLLKTTDRKYKKPLPSI
tara:strand:+ start:239 stop:562 length:324 start_codon:yes stop_codon:yes gene_type:complete